MATCAIGAAKVAGCLGSLYAPDLARRAWVGFSRHDFSGWCLAAIDVFWSGWLILHTPPFSGMDRIEGLVYAGAPLLFFLLVVFMDEMLAPRALGGFLLLLATPVLDGARWHASSLSLVMTVAAYIWVVFGMVLVVSPYRFRQLASYVTADRNRFRLSNLAGLLVGVAFLALGIAVY